MDRSPGLLNYFNAKRPARDFSWPRKPPSIVPHEPDTTTMKMTLADDGEWMDLVSRGEPWEDLVT